MEIVLNGVGIAKIEKNVMSIVFIDVHRMRSVNIVPKPSTAKLE